MESRPQNFLFIGLYGFAGFRVGQTCQLTPNHWDDGSGTVTVEMPHAPYAGRVKFEAQQWKEWWEKVK